jgi:hypothetical protein
MSKERAEGIQRTLLNEIIDTIPSRLVEPFWETYQQEVGRLKTRPCTCTPKYWLQMVEELREAVNQSLAYHNADILVELQAMEENDILPSIENIELEEEKSRRGRKKQ